MVERLADADVLLEDLTPEQRDAVTTSATPLCIIAGAGSAKPGSDPAHRLAGKTGAIDPRGSCRHLPAGRPANSGAERRSVCATTLPPAFPRSPWRSSQHWKT